MDGRLEGRCAIVTGGGRGIGRAVCRAFAREGAKLVIAGRPDDPVDLLVSRIKRHGGAAVGFWGDCAEPEDAQACVDMAVQRFGRLDVLVLAGRDCDPPTATQDVTVEAFEQIMRDNMQSSFLLTRFALEQLRETQGVILATASESRLTGLGERTVFGGSRAFMHAFINGLAVEQARYGVRANCVCPSWTQSVFNDGSATSVESKDVTLEQVAELFVHLASDAARSVTGEMLYADDDQPPVEQRASSAPAAVVTNGTPKSDTRRREPARRRSARRRSAKQPVVSSSRSRGGSRPSRPVVKTRPMDAFNCITQQLLLDD